jgi:hypothetical protein
MDDHAPPGTWHYGLVARWWAEVNQLETDELAFYRDEIRPSGEPASPPSRSKAAARAARRNRTMRPSCCVHAQEWGSLPVGRLRGHRSLRASGSGCDGRGDESSRGSTRSKTIASVSPVSVHPEIAGVQ